MPHEQPRLKTPGRWTNSELLGEAEQIASIFAGDLGEYNRVSLCLRELARRYDAACRMERDRTGRWFDLVFTEREGM